MPYPYILGFLKDPSHDRDRSIHNVNFTSRYNDGSKIVLYRDCNIQYVFFDRRVGGGPLVTFSRDERVPISHLVYDFVTLSSCIMILYRISPMSI
jgi:hypothetical protein